MRLRSPAIATAVAAIVLAVGLPVQARDGESAVSFDGVGFTFDSALGSSVNVTRVPGQPPDLDTISGPDAPHIAFGLYGPRSQGGRIPRVGLSDGVVRVYATADLAAYEGATAQLEAVRALLEERPDPATFMTITEDGAERLPHLPLDSGAAQVLRARVTYVDAPHVSGIAYLAAYRQDVFPFAAGDFWYTFQGLSSDGAWYVSADFVVEAGMFPAQARLRSRDLDRFVRRWPAYLEESTQALNAAAPDGFAPPLSAVDALVASIEPGGGSSP